MSTIRRRNTKREIQMQVVRRREGRLVEERETLRRQNEIEVLAVQVGLSYFTVVDLLNSGWKYSEIPGLKPRWVKVS